jgi:antitoxin (DNA-binding transcriptional repressor) of toxin-antitoxin stability system
MEHTISQKELYSRLSSIGTEVMNGSVYIVLRHSKPVYKMVPLGDNGGGTKKYSIKDLPQFIKKGKDPSASRLSEQVKKFVYLPNA